MLFRLRDISIRNKLVLMQVFTTVLVLSIVFTVFVINDVQSYKERKVNSMLSIAQVVSANSTSIIQFLDEDEAKQILDELHNVAPEIVHAAISDNKGKFFVSYTKKGADSFRLSSFSDEKQYVFSGQNLLVTNPVIDHNEVIGKVFLDVELSELEQIKRSKYELAGILLLVALGFSFLIAFIIQPYISKRLLRLVRTMKEVSITGDYNKSITDDGKDEISTLIKVFNNLMLQVQENQQKKDEFIGIASHELKTPLTSIKGYLDLLNLMEADDAKKQLFQKAQKNVNRLEGLIKDLLDVSKIQSGQLELNIQQFDIYELLDETVASFQMLSPSHHITWQGGRAEMIWADRQRIEQVLINLLSNAIKYSPGEKEVIVSSTKNEDWLTIKIKDFGTGISKEEQANVFERFYRTKDTSAHISGFGLGLYICRDIIQRHHGKIWVEADEKGSAFYFSLPLKKETFKLDQQ